MAYATGTAPLLGKGNWILARPAIAGAIAADNATLTDANYPITSAIDCTGWETVIVKVSVTAGTAPTMTLEALFRDDNAADGNRWVRRVLAGAALTTGAILTDVHEQELVVDGHDLVFFRVSAITNSASTTAASVYVRAGRRSRARSRG